MKSIDKLILTVIAVLAVVFVSADTAVVKHNKSDFGRPYRIEISRLAHEIENNGFENTDISECRYVTNIEKYSADFYNSESDYAVREINGELYRFDYTVNDNDNDIFVILNAALAVMSLIIIAVMIYARQKIIIPFLRLCELPDELSRGNLITPIEENKSRFFGKFLWGMEALRENIEKRKSRELELQKEKKTLLLSLSHDIKTPLSAIKLYSKALTKNLYEDKDKQAQIAENIGLKADEIEKFVSQIISASRDDFFSLEVNNGEFYLSELVKKTEKFYSERLALLKINFIVGEYSDCLLKGDIDRSVEVIQNIIENAVKYGDGMTIELSFSFEEDCLLFSVKNSGCTLPDTELPHIFDSFQRGSNSDKVSGSGLGLYICRQLMSKMHGDIFAQIDGVFMNVTAVFQLL